MILKASTHSLSCLQIPIYAHAIMCIYISASHRPWVGDFRHLREPYCFPKYRHHPCQPGHRPTSGLRWHRPHLRIVTRAAACMHVYECICTPMGEYTREFMTLEERMEKSTEKEWAGLTQTLSKCIQTRQNFSDARVLLLTQ